MRSVWIPKAGPPEVLEVRESADPTPRTGQVLVRVRAAGVNEGMRRRPPATRARERSLARTLERARQTV